MKGLYVPFTKNAVEIKRSVIIHIGERIHEMTLFLSTIVLEPILKTLKSCTFKSMIFS